VAVRIVFGAAAVSRDAGALALADALRFTCAHAVGREIRAAHAGRLGLAFGVALHAQLARLAAGLHRAGVALGVERALPVALGLGLEVDVALAAGHQQCDGGVDLLGVGQDVEDAGGRGVAGAGLVAVGDLALEAVELAPGVLGAEVGRDARAGVQHLLTHLGADRGQVRGRLHEGAYRGANVEIVRHRFTGREGRALLAAVEDR